MKDGKIRLSIDGAQLVGNNIEKNIIEIDDEKTFEWMKGRDIEVKCSCDNNVFVVLKNKNDALGCGKYTNGRILNFVSKPRRLNV